MGLFGRIANALIARENSKKGNPKIRGQTLVLNETETSQSWAPDFVHGGSQFKKTDVQPKDSWSDLTSLSESISSASLRTHTSWPDNTATIPRNALRINASPKKSRESLKPSTRSNKSNQATRPQIQRNCSSETTVNQIVNHSPITIIITTPSDDLLPPDGVSPSSTLFEGPDGNPIISNRCRRGSLTRFMSGTNTQSASLPLVSYEIPIDTTRLMPPSYYQLSTRRPMFSKDKELEEVRKFFITFMNSKGYTFPKRLRYRMMAMYGISNVDLDPAMIAKFDHESRDLHGLAGGVASEKGEDNDELQILESAFRSQRCENMWKTGLVRHQATSSSPDLSLLPALHRKTDSISSKSNKTSKRLSKSSSFPPLYLYFSKPPSSKMSILPSSVPISPSKTTQVPAFEQTASSYSPSASTPLMTPMQTALPIVIKKPALLPSPALEPSEPSPVLIILSPKPSRNWKHSSLLSGNQNTEIAPTRFLLQQHLGLVNHQTCHARSDIASRKSETVKDDIFKRRDVKRNKWRKKE